jgi:dsRNA-specific ribonuclease
LKIDETKDIEQTITSLDSNDENNILPSFCDELIIVPKSVLQKVIIPEGYPPILERLALGHSSTVTYNIISEEKIDNNGASSTILAYEDQWLKYSDSFRLIKCSKNSLVELISDIMGYKFKDFQVLDEALTHSSIMHKESNQRLEFLGDAIIDFSIIDALFRGDVEGKWTEGLITQKKIQTSNNKNLSRIAFKLRLYRYLNMASKQLLTSYEEIDDWYESQLAARSAIYENLMNERSDNEPIDYDPNEINDIVLAAYIDKMKAGVMKTLADTMEALIGAVYIDSQGNLETIKKCLIHIKLI